MISFGYKSPVSSVLRAATAIAIGLVLVISDSATIKVVKIIASLLFASGVISLICGYFNKKHGAPLVGITTNAIIDIGLGIILFLFPSSMANIIIVLIGIALVIFGIIQIFVLSGTMSLIGLGGLSFILSLLVIGGGIVLIFNPFSMKIIGIIAGILMIVYGINELMSSHKSPKSRREYDDNSSPKSEPASESSRPSKTDLDNVKDVEYWKEEK